jgi:hypothetical protein
MPGAAGPVGPGHLPSAPDADGVESVGQRVVTGERSVGGRNLAATGHAEFLAEDVGVSLDGARRDPEPGARLVVRAPGRDQDHDLALAVGQFERVGRDVRHTAELSSDAAGRPLSDRRISPIYAAELGAWVR